MLVLSLVPTGCADDGGGLAMFTASPTMSDSTEGDSVSSVSATSDASTSAATTTAADGTSTGETSAGPGTSATTSASTSNTTEVATESDSGGMSSSSGGGPGCGNGAIDAGEECDGADLQGNDCMGLGFDGGVLACDAKTCMFDTTGCNAAPGCGNGIVDPGEQCDGADLQGFDCTSFGFAGGVLTCDPVTCTFDTSGCMI